MAVKLACGDLFHNRFLAKCIVFCFNLTLYDTNTIQKPRKYDTKALYNYKGFNHHGGLYHSKKRIERRQEKYRCLVRQFEGRKVIYNKCKSFDKLALTKSRGVNQVIAFETDNIHGAENDDLTIKDMIYNYIHHDLRVRQNKAKCS